MSTFANVTTNNSQHDDELLNTLSSLVSTRERAVFSMPGAFYTSESFARLEKDRVFRSGWACVGHVGEIPNNGDYFTTEMIGEPLLVQRTSQGEVRVLSNVCRHRGNLVATGHGNAHAHVCGYHAWSYDLDGKFKRAPLMQEVKALDAAKCALPTIATTVWQNFIFVNLDGTAAPLKQSLEPLEPLVRNYHHEEQELYYTREEVWQTNWKCLAENFMEGYHLNATHPTTLRPRSPSELSEHVTGNGYFSAYRSHYTPESPQREPFHPDLTEAERRHSLIFSVFPNLVVTYMPHQTIYLLLRPASTGSVAIRWGIAGYEKSPSEENLKEYVAFADAFNAEDKVKLERLQIGLSSSFYAPGPLAPEDLEGTLRDFYGYIAHRICI
ncbi:aromatic ring-hydroxylating dioxygenase subunit alpha [Paraburkholderia sp. LEh10]|uniref:aromatic ring-hydroxylating oxygenase subunit alpha n=1 Tax=Paraburkholderia sp. LEh10 TaxID=2821353 RepID=UPI001AE333CA|nr:aromatic ring-hydroxylating dioxygenase subunit alpha [Paraburkholderia sp. LEh10]MBP0594877.1 aromatic ring-hydroxylating dioxygenase subunit alpha [Paraburkholderia sp. LEh10]